MVLAVALAVAGGALVLDMSGRAPRLAGTDHTVAASFVADLKGGQELCQPGMELPSDAERVEVLVGTYGPPVPQMTVRFLGSDDHVRAFGHIPAGAPQGNVTIPISYPHGGTSPGTLCVLVRGGKNTVLGGAAFTAGPASEEVGGVPQPGRIWTLYLRPGRESWWQLLPTLSRRFGLGKTPFLGDWALPVAALALLGVWVGAIRVLRRELV